MRIKAVPGLKESTLNKSTKCLHFPNWTPVFNYLHLPKISEILEVVVNEIKVCLNRWDGQSLSDA